MNITFNDTEQLRAKHEKTYAAGRSNLLLASVLTLISMVLVVTIGYYLNFSAYLPVSLMDEGKFYMEMDNGKYTAEELQITEEELQQYMENNDGTLDFIVTAIPAVALVGVYFLCWALSKNRSVWMIVAAILYIIDTILMIPDLLSYYFAYDVRGAVFLVLYHIWVLYYLISGVLSAAKLKKMPAPIEGNATVVSEEAPTASDEMVSASVEIDNNNTNDLQ